MLLKDDCKKQIEDIIEKFQINLSKIREKLRNFRIREATAELKTVPEGNRTRKLSTFGRRK